MRALDMWLSCCWRTAVHMRLGRLRAAFRQTGTAVQATHTSMRNGRDGVSMLGSAWRDRTSPGDTTRAQAMKNLFYVPRYRGHTIIHPVTAKYGRVKVHAYPLASGTGGVRAGRLMESICRLAGLENIGVKARPWSHLPLLAVHGVHLPPGRPREHRRQGAHLLQMRASSSCYDSAKFGVEEFMHRGGQDNAP